jgi:hypothetical protein
VNPNDVPPFLPTARRKLPRLFYLLWLPLVFALTLTATMFFEWQQFQVERIAYSAEGGVDPFFGFSWFYVMAGILVFLITMLVLFSGALIACFRNFHAVGMALSLTAIVFLGGFLGSCNAGRHVFGNPRREAFTQMGERLMPLVNAIEAFHQDLIPKYLEKIPPTGMGSHTNIVYRVGGNLGNPWMLNIDAHEGLGWNQFYYFPLENYPKGWPYERMGKWAYFHE